MEKILKAFEFVGIENIKDVNQYTFAIKGVNFTVNVTTLVMTWIVMAFLLLLAGLFTRRLSLIPTRAQAVGELIVESFQNLLNDTMGEKGKIYLPLIATIFLFVCLCNWIGVVPILKSPTQDLNTTLGLGLLVLVVAHISGILTKGFFGYIKDFFYPYFIAPLAFFINVAGECGKTISHSFRLFGNILGGGLIITVISELVHHLFLPIFLYAFFGFFTGTIQAFVFTMLALVYISVQRKE